MERKSLKFRVYMEPLVVFIVVAIVKPFTTEKVLRLAGCHR